MTAPPATRPPGFVYSQEILHCEKLPLARLALKFGTPLYVYSWTALRERVATFQQAFANFPHTLCYAVKANGNLALLRRLAALGCGFDVVSGGELERVLRADRRAAARVVFSGVGKKEDEIELALRSGILLFNVESAAELELLMACAGRLRKRARISIRVNPDIRAKTHPYITTGMHEHKFGVAIEAAKGLYARAARSRWIEIAGVSVHIGSQITDVAPFRSAMQRVADLVGTLRGRGHAIRYVDAGGGLGIPYRGKPKDFATYAKRYARAVVDPIRHLDLHLLLEPGRVLIGPAGILLTSVIYTKESRRKRFVIVDAAMNDLIRPALYGAYHEVVPVRARKPGRTRKVDVVGPVCESGDFLARDRRLPALEAGDLLAVLDTGAYGSVLSSNYNARPLAAEVLVEGKSVRQVRRRETMEDLVRCEMI